jgi:hypothetical protein
MQWAPQLSSALEVERWERLLRAERSPSFEVAKLASRVPGVRRVLGLPAHLDTPDDGTLVTREARVAQARSSVIGRLARRFERERRTAAEPAPKRHRPSAFPPIGPMLDREIDAAIELLRSVPFEELQLRGWHLQPNHYNCPLNDLRFLREHPELWIREVVPAEVEWDFDGQIELLERIAQHVPELSDVPERRSAEPGRFCWDNDASFPRGDAIAYYGIVRQLRPRRVIETGAGWSSLVLAKAVTANERDCEVTLIDPEPRWEVLGELPAGWRLIESPVQLTDLAEFESLEAGDVLFYDGSHCVRTAGDVNWIFFEVLPRLSPGVWLHVHDLMWPWDYPAPWVLDEGLSWNEQYFVQAFLIGNSAYRVRLTVGMVARVRGEEVKALIPDFGGGGSLWIEKLSGGSAPSGRG